MVGAYKNNMSYSWPLRLTALLLSIAIAAPSIASTESNFAASELNRITRSKMTPGQRRAAVVLDRYRMQKNRERKAPVPAPVVQKTDESPPPVSGETATARSVLSTKIDCSAMLAQGADKKYKGILMSRVQQELLALGFNPGGVDGMLGVNTRTAIQEYCKIDKVYPNWPRILESTDFGKWVDKAPDQTELDREMTSGNSATVIALLDRYMKKRAFTPVTWTGDFLVSYTLTEGDFKQLGSQKEILARIAKLQNQAYASREEFEAALEEALKGASEPERYIQIVERYVEPQSGVMLTENSLNSLKVENVPDFVLQSLQELKGLKYPKAKMDGEVDARLSMLAEKTMGFEPEIVKLVRISPNGARFTDDSLKKFADAHAKDGPLAAAILDRLQKMEQVIYQSDKTMAAAVNNVLMQIVEQIRDTHGVIVESAVNVPAYNLSDKSMQEIDKQLEQFVIPAVYLELISSLQNVEYPDSDLLWLAMKSRIFNRGFNNIFRRKIFGVIEMSNADEIDDSLLEKFKTQGLPPANLAILATLQGRRFDDTKALEVAVDALYEQLSNSFDQFRPLIIAQSRKAHRFDKTKTIQWSGDSCGCVHRNLAGDVYGFYPYWMAGGQQRIDFSVLTRVGYYGLGFNDKGEIAHESRWSNLDTRFIRNARSYGTKVDLVIYRNDWKSWSLSSAEDKAAAFENLAGNITNLIGIPLTDLFSETTPYISMGLSKKPIMGDGVILYFDGYPQDPESVQAFGEFIRILSEKLRAKHRSLALNLMFRSSEMGKGIYDYYKLIAMMDTIKGHDGELKSLFLALLQEPTTYDKKKLRMNVENGLHGNNRMKLLRNIAMVITYDGHDVYQLTDDSIYARDNFGGIGFWTQPIAQGAGAAPPQQGSISTVLQEHYLNSHGDAPSVCKYICPHKWAYRIAWGCFFFTLLALVILRFTSCRWMSFFDRNFIYLIAGVVVPTIVLSFALLVCDPSWQEMSGGHSGLVVLLMAGIGYSIWNYKDKKRKARLP